jgi:hypothetical protein
MDDKVMTNSALVEVFVEFKWNSVDNPFYNPEPNSDQSFLHGSKTALDTLGQITSYATVQLSTQF